MLFSFVMPFYNNEKYLEEAIKSVLKSSVQEFELILVDDGSTDNSLEIARKYALISNKIKIFSHPSNLGPAKALKTSLKQCLGKYILFTAADDVSFSHRARRCLQTFESDSKIGMVISEAVIINEISEPTNEFYRIPNYIDVHNLAIEQMKRNYCLGATIAIKNDKGILNKKDILEYADDYELSIEYIIAGYDIGVIREPLLNYRIHSNSVSNNKAALYSNTKKALNRIASEKIHSNLQKRGFDLINIEVALGTFNLFRGNVNEGLNYLQGSLKLIEEEIDLSSALLFELYFYLGVALYIKNDLKKSLNAFEKASEYNHQDPALLNNLAVLYTKVDADFEKSNAHIAKCIRIQSNYLDAQKNKRILESNYNIEDLKLTERILGKSLIHRENYIV
ncbi:glycosyltransferase family 2 protein [Domibacillus enclensis]|uniref:Glycosyl transferase family 2 n=1 Tax=Domibacillus enclensis TaxID=1017273 RepID=A0A1N6SCX9_9BACI|nr:glycosyltransferase [Domibacillus enclensis]OXS79291.1 hypothetical protein B1B05_05835 [Domibacillus enclensis]SIQ39005.1 Glycosyl transferase family 2 [Domibacillus enclensis]